MLARVQDALDKAKIPYSGALLDSSGVRVRFADTDTQLKAKDTVEAALNPNPADADYTVALNLLPASPNWLTAIHALPMYLGLDLRGGVHFLLKVDMRAALTKRLDGLSGEIRSLLREKTIRHGGVARDGETLRVRFRDAAQRGQARDAILNLTGDLELVERDEGADLLLVATSWGSPSR
jgi:preprotein translocase subunit SecD